MSSFATAGAGTKAVTSLLPGRRCYSNQDPVTSKATANALNYVYYTAGLKTAVNVTGAGVWVAGFLVSYEDLTTARVKVTIDGVVVLDDDQDPGAKEGTAQCGSMYSRIVLDASLVGSAFSEGHVVFNTSLLIEVEASHTSHYLYNYTLN